MVDSPSERLLNSAARNQWKEIGVRHHHGICVPLFSLHTLKSAGIGEYLDLIPLIEFCKEIGFDVIQLLPLNDTGLGTSPYSAISAFALNPIHLSLWALPEVTRIPQCEEKIAHLRKWNLTHRVKYPIVRELKHALLRDYYQLVFPEIAKTREYERFVAENHWLEPYALFKAIKESRDWSPWETWPDHLQHTDPEHRRELYREYRERIGFHKMVQYLAYQQFSEVKKVANSHSLLIKGDIPILIDRDSADVWGNPSHYHLDLAAGAPPDMYTKDGQDWGFPTYNWQTHRSENFRWWKERLRVAAKLYHLYRIDHVVGFFRIWSIPRGQPARNGHFVPENDSIWIPHGKELMQMMLDVAPILPIGEDLGVVPPEVKACLTELGIPGTKMMRWERDFEGDGSFYPSEHYQAESMTTVSTHDSDTLQLWWKHFPKEARAYAQFKGWPYHPFLSSERQKEILYDAHHSGSLFHINLLQEYLALFPNLVSIHPGRERINVPGKILPTNWTYRYIPSIEEMHSHSLLKRTLRELIE